MTSATDVAGIRELTADEIGAVAGGNIPSGLLTAPLPDVPATATPPLPVPLPPVLTARVFVIQALFS